MFYVFLAENFHEMNRDNFSSSYVFTKNEWMVILLIPMILISMIRTLSVIAFLSAAGNILVIIAFIFLMQVRHLFKNF